jgi:hypothetical protein
MLALASVTTEFILVVIRLGNVFGKTHITDRSASARTTIVALHLVVFGLLYLYFPKGCTTKKMIE